MTTAPLQANSKEEQLLSSLRGVLESKNYPWARERAVTYKLGAGGSPTHSLKDLLISSSVDMEAATDANITALCTMDIEPVDCTSCFEELLSFSEQCDSAHKSDISLILYPIFVHIYLDLVAGGHSELAASFYDKFAGAVNSAHKSEVKELTEITTVRQLSTSTLAAKFRNQKYNARMSNKAFQLMMQFLQVCQTPVLLSMIQKHLAIEVYGEASVSNGDPKGDQKKPSNSPTFIIPKLPQLDDNRIQAKNKSKHPVGSHGRGQGFTVAMTDSHTGKGSKPMQRTSSATHVPAHLAEFKDKLTHLSQLDPTTLSVALHTITTQENRVHCSSFNAASRQYACGFADSSLHVWSTIPQATTSTQYTTTTASESQRRSRTPDHSVLRGHYGPVYGSCFSSSGEFLLSASEDRTVRLWNVKRRTSLVSYRGHAYPVWDVAFSPVDVYFASASYDRTARLWATDLVYPLRIFAGHTQGVDVVQFHPNGRYIATGSLDQTCRLWDIQNGQCVRLMPGSKGPVTCLAFSPGGKLLVSGGEDGVLRVWDLGSGGVLRECRSSHPANTSTNQITSLAFSPDGTLLASSDHSNEIKLWNVRTLSIPSQNSNQTSSDADLISRCPTPSNCQVLRLQFTHKNCLHVIATTTTTTTTTANTRSHTGTEPMDTSTTLTNSYRPITAAATNPAAVAPFQQLPLLPTLQTGAVGPALSIPFD